MAEAQVLALTFRTLGFERLQAVVTKLLGVRGFTALPEHKPGCVELLLEGDDDNSRVIADDTAGAMKAVAPALVKELRTKALALALSGRSTTPNLLLTMDAQATLSELGTDGTAKPQPLSLDAELLRFVDEEPAPSAWNPQDERNALSSWLSGLAGEVMESVAPGAVIPADHVQLFFAAPRGDASKRLQALAASIATAKSWDTQPQPDGRTLVRITLVDGGKQQSFLKSDELETLQRLVKGG